MESGKACGSGFPSVLGRNTTAAVNRPISGIGVVCPFPTNAINICVDGGVRTSCASHFSFSCDSLHVHLCWIPPLLSPLQTLGKVIILSTLYSLHFGLSFFFFAWNQPIQIMPDVTISHQIATAPPTPTPILPASRNTTSFFMSNYSHCGATVKRQRRYPCQKGFELQEAMNYSKPFFNSPQKWNVRACCCIFLSTISYRPLQELDRGQTLFCIMIFLFLRLSFFSPTNLFLLPLALILI